VAENKGKPLLSGTKVAWFGDRSYRTHLHDRANRILGLEGHNGQSQAPVITVTFGFVLPKIEMQPKTIGLLS
jgi:hypothetical protein